MTEATAPVRLADHHLPRSMFGRVALVAIVCAVVLLVQVAAQLGFPLADSRPARRELWSTGEVAALVVIWALGLVLIVGLMPRRRLHAVALTARTVAAAMLVAAAAAAAAGDGRLEYAVNFSGSAFDFAATLCWGLALSAMVFGLPAALFTRGDKRRRFRVAAWLTVAGALLAPVAIANEVIDRVGLWSAIVLFVLPLVLTVLLILAQRPGAVATALAVVVGLAYAVFLGPIIAFATYSGSEDAFYSQSWLTFLGLGALWYAISLLLTPRSDLVIRSMG